MNTIIASRNKLSPINMSKNFEEWLKIMLAKLNADEVSSPEEVEELLNQFMRGYKAYSKDFKMKCAQKEEMELIRNVFNNLRKVLEKYPGKETLEMSVEEIEADEGVFGAKRMWNDFFKKGPTNRIAQRPDATPSFWQRKRASFWYLSRKFNEINDICAQMTHKVGIWGITRRRVYVDEEKVRKLCNQVLGILVDMYNDTKHFPRTDPLREELTPFYWNMYHQHIPWKEKAAAAFNVLDALHRALSR